MYSLRTPRDLPMDARNTIANSSIIKGISSNENTNDITVHNDAILLTAVNSELPRAPNSAPNNAKYSGVSEHFEVRTPVRFLLETIVVEGIHGIQFR